MTNARKVEEHPEEELWRQLKHVHAGMLGVEGSHQHMQPMSHFMDQENGRLWFFTARDSDLFREIGAEGAHAHFCIIGKHQDFHACLMGNLKESRDRAKIDEYWSDIVAAWFGGKDDPNLVLLSFDLIDASLWASTRNPVKFAWEIEHAKDSIKKPDVGARADVTF
jgi:general stress protein 26